MGERCESRGFLTISDDTEHAEKASIRNPSLDSDIETSQIHPYSMVTLWLPYGYPMVTLWLPYRYPMVTLWLPYGSRFTAITRPVLDPKDDDRIASRISLSLGLGLSCRQRDLE